MLYFIALQIESHIHNDKQLCFITARMPIYLILEITQKNIIKGIQMLMYPASQMSRVINIKIHASSLCNTVQVTNSAFNASCTKTCVHDYVKKGRAWLTTFNKLEFYILHHHIFDISSRGYWW